MQCVRALFEDQVFHLRASGLLALCADVARGRPHQHRESAWLGDPIVNRGIVERHGSLIERERHCLGLPRLQHDASESFQLLHRTVDARWRLLKIQLSDLRPGASSAVAHAHADADGLAHRDPAGRNLELAVIEGGPLKSVYNIFTQFLFLGINIINMSLSYYEG